MDRRTFLFSNAAALAANSGDKIRVACVGLRGRGKDHLRAFAAMPDVEIAALCDVDESILEARSQDLEKAGRKRPPAFVDFRRLLEDKSIQAVSLATPNHWHTLQAIWACQAGKDVYVEKPCSYNMFEARQIVAAARKYDRIVQHGPQRRSSPALQQAIAQLRAGVIGDVYMSRGLCFKWRDSIGRTPESPAPAGVDYDLWLGPAPKRAFTRNRFHYNWHWFWDYGNGDIGNQGIHQLDMCLWGLGAAWPTRISAMGGHFLFDDDQETPNTITATFEFANGGKKKMLVFEVRHWMTNAESIIAKRKDSAVLGNIFYGSKGYLTVDSSDGYKTYLGREQEPGPSGQPDPGNHFRNFIDCVRSRKHAGLNAPIEEGAKSSALIHLANISYRLGRTLNFDHASYSCAGDEEATRMFTRNYRKPFVVPEKV